MQSHSSRQKRRFTAVLLGVEGRLTGVDIADDDVGAVIEESLSDCLTDTACRAGDDRSLAFETEPRSVGGDFDFFSAEGNFVANFGLGDRLVFDVNGAFEEIAFAAVELDRDMSEVHEVAGDFGAGFEHSELCAADFERVAGFDDVGEFAVLVEHACIAELRERAGHFIVEEDDHLGGGDKILHLTADLCYSSGVILLRHGKTSLRLNMSDGGARRAVGLGELLRASRSVFIWGLNY